MKPLPLLSAFLILAGGSLRAAEQVDYLRDIKPILAQNCYACHGPDKHRSGLRLDTAAAVLHGGNSGPAVIAGQSGESLLVKAVTGAKDVKAMPPKEPRLTAQQIALLRTWIDQGAKAPLSEVAATAANRSKHWAFQKPVRPAEPAVKDPSWVRNPIDRFILARLEREGLTPSPEAGRVTLLRRLSLDLLGLPPTLEEVEAFLHDDRPDGYERLVDRLLASPHYGERWGRHWLDLARYADSNGYSIDAPRSIWKYRDWVLDALNRDMPFDEFTIEQLAGDLLPSATLDQRIATGFHRNTSINQEGGINVEQFRIESIVDRVNTTGSVFLGLTVGCAQCHDHKFDPLSQREYYQLFAFLNNVDEPTLDLATPEATRQRKQVRARVAALEKERKLFDTYSAAAQDRWESGLTPSDRQRLPPAIRAILEIPENGRIEKQKQTLTAYYRQLDLARHVVGGLGDPLPFLAASHAALARFRTSVEKQIAALKKSEPQAVTTMVVQERKQPRTTHVLLGGDFTRPGATVTPSVPAVLPPLQAQGSQATGLTRLDLARWFVDRDNPLTARVTVNRLWLHHFGIGLVETENDFGTQGTPPSHPELLDWLATEFHARNWSLKAMHRLIVTSATYRQASRHRPELVAVDARNRLLARQSRLRLEAEVVRDVALAASGLLTPKIGGPSVHPPQPEGIYRFTQVPRDWKADSGPDRFRRGLYTYFWRSAPHPGLIVFDAPDATSACTRRNRSNTPLQALTLLNDEAFFEFAQALAARVLREAGPDDRERLRHAFRLCLARSPSALEEKRLGELLATHTTASLHDAWITMARVLLNLDEFITRE
jgi:mono/diheme cytochrome c family protein